MARTNSEQNSTPTTLPPVLPEIALQHHGKTLFGPMKEWKIRRQIPPVLLLTGQPGIGKRLVAHFLAQWILCENTSIDKEPGPCHQCSSCRKAMAGNGVDLIEISADKDEESDSSLGTLKIDQFRKLKASIGFSAHESQFKIILIPYADRMTTQAANSILKLLEETPPGWIFFLTASDPSLLLPTLVSRCQTLRLKPFSTDEIQELLKNSGIDSQKRKICAELAQGSWSRALLFAEEEIWQQRKVIFQFFQNPTSVLQSLVEWASQEPHHFEILMDLLEQFTADFIRWSAIPNPPLPQNYVWRHEDGKEEFSFHAKQTLHRFGHIHLARAFWIARAEQIAQARQDSLAPLNRKLLIQSLLLPWATGI